MSRTWEDNAHEFGALAKQGRDVRLALLVACSVEKQPHGGDRRSSRERDLNGKVPASTFAKKAGTTTDRILRHLDAWDKAAAKGWCKASSTLTPADADSTKVKTPTETDFKSVFTSDGERPSGGRPRSPIKEIIAEVEKNPVYAEELVKAVTEAAPEMVADRIKRTPKGREALRRTDDEDTEWTERAEKVKEQAKEAAKNRRQDLVWLDVDSLLAEARKRINEALEQSKAINFRFDAEGKDLLLGDLDKIAATVDLFRLGLTGEITVDWDAELSKITGGEEK